MAIQTFTAGQVLTAAQMTSLQTNDYNQTVSTKTASYTLVAADKGTRVVMNSASATTITVNTSLFNAGDTLFLQNISTGVCTVTAGTATVSSAGSLAIPQNGSGILYFTSAGVSIYYPSAVTASAAGLTLISTTTIGTTVSSVTISGAFSATYENYKIMISGGVSSANCYLKFTLGASATAYYEFMTFGEFTAATVNGANTSNGNFWQYTGDGYASQALFMNTDLIGPQLAKYTRYGTNIAYTSGNGSGYSSGVHRVATAYTDFTVTPNTGTLTGGTIRVYGYQNS